PRGLTNSLSDGIVSGQRKQIDDDATFIQTTAAISPGSSGGPLFSKDGLVIGVTTASIRDAQNLNLAIPVKTLKKALTRREKPQTLASAGGQPLKKHEAQQLEEVWVAIDKEDFGNALRLLAKLRDSQSESAVYWFVHGFIQSKLGNHELAIDAWKASL